MADNEYDEDDLALRATTSPGPERETSQMLLPRVLLEHAVGLEALNDWGVREGFCLIVKAPSADWVSPIERYIMALGQWDLHHTCTTTSRNSDDTVVRQTVSALSSGRRVLGVSQDPARLLPAAMVTAADQYVELEAATARIVDAVIKAVSGEEPEGLTDSMLTGLSFPELASCIRLGSDAGRCVARLTAAGTKKGVIDTMVDTAPMIEDLHGYGAAKEWALDLIADLDAWRRGELAFDQIDRHVVLEGAPGLGKTQFARSLARSVRLPLVATSMSQWFANGPGYLDSVIKQIDAAFSAARAVAPAIMLIDELDGIPDRATLGPRHREWWVPVISHILTTLDGATSGLTSELIIIGATNYIDRVDAALLRPGRLTRVIHVDHPDEAGIVGILRHHLAGDLAGEDLTSVAQLGFGATGADIMQWVKDARRTARRDGRELGIDDLLTVVAPREERPPAMEEYVAIHEAGHAVVGHLLGLKVEAISLRGRDGASGYVKFEYDDRAVTRDEVERLVVQLLAGRAAEEAFIGSPGLGAGSDLAAATQQIGRLHLSIGLGDTLIHRADARGVSAALDRHPKVAASVEAELQRHYLTALELVRRNEALIRLVSHAARKEGYLTGEVFARVVDGAKS